MNVSNALPNEENGIEPVSVVLMPEEPLMVDVELFSNPGYNFTGEDLNEQLEAVQDQITKQERWE